MTTSLLRRTLVGLVATATATVLVVPATAGPSAARRPNPTGTHAGSAANGTGNLRLGISATSDGRVLVTWRPNGPVSRVRNFVVRVGPNRSLDVKTRRYLVRRTATSLVVPRAFGASGTSGNYTFVKVIVRLRNGHSSGSLTKWIQAPLAAGCPSGPQAKVATFNVRSWGRPDNGVPRKYRWSSRGKHVVEQILRSGAHVIAVQEASGLPKRAYGNVRQTRWILNRLNATDPDRSARWADVLPDDALRGGLTGTRVFYDASKYVKLASGFRRITDRRAPTTYATWGRLRATGSNTPFAFVSTHLAQGESRTTAAARLRQVRQIIPVVTSLHQTYGDQVVLAGDFNSTANNRPYNTAQYPLIQAGFYDAFATARIANARFGTTNNFHFPIRATPYRRDYILTYGGVPGSCGYANRAYRTARNVASDHFLQVANVPISGS